MPDVTDAMPPSRTHDAAAPVAAVHDAVRAALAPHERVLLAVSGGLDSMALLDAAVAVARPRLVAVATFDHGTGPAARRAAALVMRTARALGLRVVRGRAALPEAGEAAWRDARWRFLRRAAARVGAEVVATAHTRDDQLETVAMRVLRGAGARGLAALYAPTAGVVRPVLGLPRAALAAYATERGVAWLEDPSNASPRFLRNRVRHALLPALERARPGFGDDLLRIAREAAAWRAEVEAWAAQVPLRHGAAGDRHVALAVLGGYDAEGLAVLWPALAARAGVRLDRRGTARLVEFTIRAAAEAVPGASIQLAGAAEVVLIRGSCVQGGGDGRELVLRRSAVVGKRRAPEAPAPRPLAGAVRYGGWSFRPSDRHRPGEAAPDRREADDPWSATLPRERPLVVRAWRPGDRMRAPGAQAARRVKRFFADARIPGRARGGWPVVVAPDAVGGEEVVWIPGVRRSDAATARPGVPVQRYICEPFDQLR